MLPFLLIQPTCRWSQCYQVMNIHSIFGINNKKTLHKALLKLLNASESQDFFFFFTSTWIAISRGCNTGPVVIWPAVCTSLMQNLKCDLQLELETLVSGFYTFILIWICRYLIFKFIQIQTQLNDISRRSWGYKKVHNNIPKKYRNKPDAWLIQLEIAGLQALPESPLKLMEGFSLHHLGLAFDCKCMPVFQKHKIWITVKAAHENTANSLKSWRTG